MIRVALDMEDEPWRAVPPEICQACLSTLVRWFDLRAPRLGKKLRQQAIKESITKPGSQAAQSADSEKDK